MPWVPQLAWGRAESHLQTSWLQVYRGIWIGAGQLLPTGQELPGVARSPGSLCHPPPQVLLGASCFEPQGGSRLLTSLTNLLADLSSTLDCGHLLHSHLTSFHYSRVSLMVRRSFWISTDVGVTHSGLVVMCRRVMLPHPASVSMTVINIGFVASFMNHFTPIKPHLYYYLLHMYVYVTSFFKTSCNLFYSSFIEIEFIYHTIQLFKGCN